MSLFPMIVGLAMNAFVSLCVFAAVTKKLKMGVWAFFWIAVSPNRAAVVTIRSLSRLYSFAVPAEDKVDGGGVFRFVYNSVLGDVKGRI